MKHLLLVFVAYGGNVNGSVGNIEVDTTVFPPTLKLIKDAEAQITKLLGCDKVIVVNWKELSDELENRPVERKETVQ